ncbi:cation efflux protein [Aspergillus karnatakaensis]|uniref:putative di-, tri-valent inorganic cation transporter n=1 Tax=Aspergillus karnatakaensis TaxID=1810916 RepID=UPI003CCCC8ED
MKIRISRSQRLIAATTISAAFFLTEISVGFYTHSLALVADAFHYLNDLVGFIVALAALRVSQADHAPQELSFGWQRAQVLGAFFNGSLLFALGISIFLQSIERFITLHHVENPKLMFIIGSIGLGLNIICATFLHEHHHDHDHGHHDHHHGVQSEVKPHGESDVEQQGGIEDQARHLDHRHQSREMVPAFGGHDLGMMGVMLHVLGDAANNLGVMIAALVIWLTSYEARYYADPATSMGIAAMIMLSALPLVRQSGLILLESAPKGLKLEDVKHDIEQIPGVLAVHELHIWRLNQQKVLASVHVTITDHSKSGLSTLETIRECFHCWGIHSVTVQPEIAAVSEAVPLSLNQIALNELDSQEKYPVQCQSKCSSLCKELACC